jgi:hypothetical protein
MKKYLIIFLFLFFLVTPLAAQNSTTRFFVAYDYANLTVDNTVGGVPLGSAELAGSKAQSVTFTVVCNGGGVTCPFRFTIDTTAPTTSVGLWADYGASVTIYSNTNLRNFRAIRQGATSAILNVTYLQ